MGKIKQLLAELELTRAKRQAVKARKAEPHNADAAFNDAYQKFSVAATFDPENAAVKHHWGLALLDHGRIKGGPEGGKLFKSACEYFQAAFDITPDDPKILIDWGAALMEQARQKSTKVANPFYKKAKEKFLAAESLKPGLAAYNLACLHSLQGEQEECKKRLEEARDTRFLPSNKFLNGDDDLKPCREEAWFKAFLDSLTQPEKAPPAA